MNKITTVLALTALLGACDSKNPFMEDEPEEIVVASPDETETETLDPNDPNTDVNSQYAYDPAQRLTMNSVDYDDKGTVDPSDDELVINNLPFDGPDGVYTEQATFTNGTRVFESQQTGTTGLTKTFAVFVQSDFLEATSAASGQWRDFGYAGANINRESFDLPGTDGEYVYQGNYVATRTFSDRGGIELVTGSVELRLDELDFDPSGDIEGAIDGDVFNRNRQGAAGALGLGDLPTIVLAVTSFNGETGVWEGGAVGTDNLIGEARDTGTYDGMIAGPNGEEIGGYLVMAGPADIQRVNYQVVEYRLETFVPTVNPLTGDTLTDLDGNEIGTIVVTAGVSSGLDSFSTVDFQNQINARQNLPDATLLAGGVPAGADILSDRTEFIDFTTEYNAREIGVFIGDILPFTP